MKLHSWGSGSRHYLGLHGWGGGFHTFEPLLDHLPADATLHSFDMPGYGDSPRLGTWDVTELTSALVELVDSIPEPQLTLVGNCSGADFGIPLAQARPHRFSRVVLLDPFAFFPWYFKLLSSRGVGRLFYATAFENPVGRWVTNQRLREHRTEDSNLTASFESLDHDVVHAYLVMLRQLPAAQEFRGLTLPVDVVYGENTFPAVRESVAVWKSIWPHARTFELAGAGHLPIQEATQALADVIFEV